ncbi:MAG: UDP-N-acetylmuramoyl-L-alanyl-D-glutamate--2,6-diaminopimelate ligase [Acidobacteria bacterium]|nr:UDP-N-acetylmuramoyl-L-alanyl-D-glutamate--2,6-diaminopimelate ligase [Acidobacteriota bacterium]MBS1866890.1 UDP-N-acetylmuramoyl-L-alanyl-D-glutamate--2,6-diaminopimelate ligase [Acidobacteriota bacterium]
MAIELQEKEKKLVNETGLGTGNSVSGETQRAAQRLDALLSGAGATLSESQSPLLIRNVACDSRKVRPQGLFFALQGAKEDGTKFVRDAVSRGAIAVVSESPAPALLPDSIAWIQVPAARKALAIAAANFYGHPADSLKIAAVTGTNGKTTTTSVIDSIIKASGAKTGLFGTIAYHTPLGDYPAPNTTPESVDLQGFFAEIRDAGGQFATLEASSHSLMMDRLWGCHFQAAVFTNLTREHMDFHKTFEDYFAAKRRLFEGTGAGPAEIAILNADDEYGPRLAGIAKSTVMYGIENAVEISAKKFQLNFSGLTFTASTPNGKLQIVSSLVGRINVYNLLAAIGAAQALGLSNEIIEQGIRNLASVSGRFQQVALGQPFLVIVDYAHTDDALENLIKTARELNPKGRVITLFGCGGGKDRTKRPIMGEVAGRLSDLTILTNDNPRKEDPLKIISDVVVGLQKAAGKYLIEPDREKAIIMAIDEAREGDIVLLAGKGHEDYQALAETTLPWDDREQARRALRDRGYGEEPPPKSGPGNGFGT